METQLTHVHQAHETAMRKLKSDLHRKQTLLTAAKVEADRLKSDLQTVMQDKEQAHVSTQGKCHAAKSQHADAKMISQVLVNSTVILCRLVLRTTTYMQSGSNSFIAIYQYRPLLLRLEPPETAGSKKLCNASLAAQVCFGMPGMTGMQPDDVAELVGLSATEISDLLGTTKHDVTSTLADSSGTVAHIASLLTAIHDVVCQVNQPNPPLSEPSGLQVHLTALVAVMEAEARKSEGSFDSWVAALPTLARACTQNPDAPSVLHDALINAPQLRNVTDQIDRMFMSSIEFYTDFA